MQGYRGSKPKQYISEAQKNAGVAAREAYKQDRRAFFRDCLRIRHRDNPAGGLKPMVLTHAQEALLTLIEKIESFNFKRFQGKENKVDVIIYKPRKEGMSTLVAGLGFHMCELYPHTNALIMAHRKDGAQNIGGISRRFNNFFPREAIAAGVKATLERCQDDILEWGHFNGDLWDSRLIIATSKDEGVARGYDFNFVHLSEVAHFPNSDAISAAKNALVPSQYYCFEESTANGIDHSFYGSWQSAMNFEEVYSYWKEHGRTPPKWNGKYKFFWAWWQDPHYTLTIDDTEAKWLDEDMSDEELAMKKAYNLTHGQIAWRRYMIQGKCSEQRKMAPEDFFRQEYPANPVEGFVSSGNRVFNEAKLMAMETSAKALKPKWHGSLVLTGEGACEMQPRSGSAEWSPLVIYADPRPNAYYVIGGDAAEGVTVGGDGDYSVAVVFDRTDGVNLIEVARYRWRTRARELGDVIYWLWLRYNKAFVIQEANPPGNATCQRLVELGCYSQYRRQNEEQVGEAVSDENFVPGFRTLMNTKRMIIEHAQSALSANQLRLHNVNAIQEWRMYCNEDGKLGAPSGEHDDCVMADALAIYAHRNAAPPVILSSPRIAASIKAGEVVDPRSAEIAKLVAQKKKRDEKRNKKPKQSRVVIGKTSLFA